MPATENATIALSARKSLSERQNKKHAPLNAWKNIKKVNEKGEEPRLKPGEVLWLLKRVVFVDKAVTGVTSPANFQGSI